MHLCQVTNDLTMLTLDKCEPHLGSHGLETRREISLGLPENTQGLDWGCWCGSW